MGKPVLEVREGLTENELEQLPNPGDSHPLSPRWFLSEVEIECSLCDQNRVTLSWSKADDRLGGLMMSYAKTPQDRKVAPPVCPLCGCPRSGDDGDKLHTCQGKSAACGRQGYDCCVSPGGLCHDCTDGLYCRDG